MKTPLSQKYQYELRVGDSTADKSYDTPNISQEIVEETREKTVVSTRLFQGDMKIL